MENVLEAFRCTMKYPELSDVPISTGLLIGFHDFNTFGDRMVIILKGCKNILLMKYVFLE
jgi:hypothetical protein